MEAVKADAVTLMSLAQGHIEFKDLISNPTVSNQAKSDIIKNTFTGKLQSETIDFLYLLIKKGRLGQLGSICEAIIYLVNQAENLTQVKLTTATALSDTDKSQIATKFLGNRKYEIQSVVNSALLGGFILEFDNKILDNSISTQLQTLKNNLIN